MNTFVSKILFFFLLSAGSVVGQVYVPIQFNRIYQFYGGLQVKEISAPSTPPANFGHVYEKSDGRLYFKNDGGTEYLLTPGGGAGTVSSIATTSPITGGTITTTGTIGISDAAANGTTKGAATFTAADFDDDGSGKISLDYANGQAATSGQDGFLQSADWTTFNNKGYTLTLTGSQGTFVDGSSYFSGAITTGTSTTAAINRVYIPVTGTITDIVVYQLTAGTTASGENSSLYIRYDNTTDVTISTAVLNTGASESYTAHGLSQAVTADHYIELKYLSASWGTNPTNVRWTCVVFIK